MLALLVPLPSVNGRSSSRPGLLAAGSARLSASTSAAPRATDHSRTCPMAPTIRAYPLDASSVAPSSSGPSTVRPGCVRMPVVATWTPFTYSVSVPKVRSTTMARVANVPVAIRPPLLRTDWSPDASCTVPTTEPSLATYSP